MSDAIVEGDERRKEAPGAEVKAAGRKRLAQSKTTRLFIVISLVIGVVVFGRYLAQGADEWSSFRACRTSYRATQSKFGPSLEDVCGAAPFRYYGLAAALDGVISSLTWFVLLFGVRAIYRYVQRGD